MLASTLGFSQSGDFARFGEELDNRIELYPNPASEYLTIQISDSKLIKPTIVVHNIIGNTIRVELEKLEEDKFQISVKNLPDGYYLVSIKDSGTKFSKTYKFLKK